jgi:hypothetical protein
MSRETPKPPPVETDERFPSGPWTGFFLQPMLHSGRSWMELHLTFRDGQLTGEGRDWVGDFRMRGRYDVSTGRCTWIKSYIGRHSVAYDGYNEGKGIWGNWAITVPPMRGGFYIWPVGMSDPTQPAKAAEADAPGPEVELIVEEAAAEPAGVGA